ncbi:MAG: hypothetical protein V4574_07255 [Pseudomonadota bacterium]
MAAIALLLGLINIWTQLTARRHFPRAHAEWKRPTRMRVRWNDATLMIAGAQGFGSFAWNGLHAWLDAPGELVVFTGMFDPVPIPHGALAADDLANLRAQLAAAEVPAAWTALSAQQQGLKRVFR